jgi:hypothetical protein
MGAQSRESALIARSAIHIGSYYIITPLCYSSPLRILQAHDIAPKSGHGKFDKACCW